MPRGVKCPECKRIPVSGKTWSLLTSQDELIKRLKIENKKLRAELAEAKSELTELKENNFIK